jgi:CxxC motif-containing protein
MEGGQIVALNGFTCDRGREYGQEEVTAPKRMLTTTVRVLAGELPLLPVVSAAALPKDKVMACVRCLSNLSVNAPIKEGDVVCANVLGLGVDIIASRDMGVSRSA